MDWENNEHCTFKSKDKSGSHRNRKLLTRTEPSHSSDVGAEWSSNELHLSSQRGVAAEGSRFKPASELELRKRGGERESTQKPRGKQRQQTEQRRQGRQRGEQQRGKLWNPELAKEDSGRSISFTSGALEAKPKPLWKLPEEKVEEFTYTREESSDYRKGIASEKGTSAIIPSQRLAEEIVQQLKNSANKSRDSTAAKTVPVRNILSKCFETDVKAVAKSLRKNQFPALEKVTANQRDNFIEQLQEVLSDLQSRSSPKQNYNDYSEEMIVDVESTPDTTDICEMDCSLCEIDHLDLR